jgi:hypothetical protein
MTGFWAAMPQVQVAISIKTRYQRDPRRTWETSPTSTRCPSPTPTAHGSPVAGSSTDDRCWPSVVETVGRTPRGVQQLGRRTVEKSTSHAS